MKTFIITSIPTRVLLKMFGADIVPGSEYDILDQANFTAENIFGYPCHKLDSFKYKVKKDGVLSSNEGTVDISFNVTILDNASLVEDNTMGLQTQYKFTDVIPLNNNYDRIRIDSISGKGRWLLSGNVVQVGDIFFNYQIKDNLVFNSSDLGSKDDYNEITFVFGHKGGFYTNVNTLTTNTVSDAKLVFDSLDKDIEEVRETPDFYNITDYNFQIQNAPEDSTYEIEVDTTSYPGMGTNAEDELTISDGTTTTVINTQSVHILTGTSNEYGYLNFTVSAKQKAPTATAGNIEIELTEINGLTSGIDPSNNIINIALPIVTL